MLLHNKFLFHRLIPECGVSMTVAEERILGGQDAGFGQFPWTALIQIKGQQLDKMCAGTLVNNRYQVKPLL